MNRFEALEKFLEEDPRDPFNYYALALEYLKTDPAKAGGLFEILLEKFPDYLPTYYPYAHLLIDIGQADKAEKLFHAGIERAIEAKDGKTVRELKAALADWQFNQE